MDDANEIEVSVIRVKRMRFSSGQLQDLLGILVYDVRLQRYQRWQNSMGYPTYD